MLPKSFALVCAALLAPALPALAAEGEDEERVLIASFSGYDPCCSAWEVFDDDYAAVRMDVACPDGFFHLRLLRVSEGAGPGPLGVQPGVEVLADVPCTRETRSAAVPDLEEDVNYLWSYQGLGVEEPVSMTLTGVRA